MCCCWPAAGEANTRIAERAGVSVATAFAVQETGLADLGVVRAGRGRKPSITTKKVEGIVHATCTRNL